MQGADTFKPDPASHALVATQLGGILLACYVFGPQGSYAWLGLCAAGALLGAVTLFFNRPGNFSIYPEPKVDARLITAGPYAYVRHPMYSALMLLMAGIGAYNGGWPNLLGALAVAVAVNGKARKEERYLQRKFADYADYARRTGRFVPRHLGARAQQ